MQDTENVRLSSKTYGQSQKWGLILIGLVLVIGSGRWSWAQQQAKPTGRAKFERVHESFGAPRIKPAEGPKMTKMTRRRRIILNDDGGVGFLGEERGWAQGDYEEEAGGGGKSKDFLGVRFESCVNTQVDSYFLCVGCTSKGPASLHPYLSMAQFFYWGERGKIHPIIDEATRLFIDRGYGSICLAADE